LRLSFATTHICNFRNATRSCLLHNDSFAPDILSQCNMLPNIATSATRAVCALLLDAPVSTLPPIIDSLATLLSKDLSPLTVCLESKNPTAPAMKKLLLAISSTESRDPRDPTATATNLLNLCHSPCRDSSTATLLAMVADSIKTSQSGQQMFPSFCTSPVIALLWQHANNSPRECSDSMITYVGTVSGDMGVTACGLRSMLPVYIAMCDAQAIHCEETFMSMPAAERDACDHTMEGNGDCSSECASFVAKVSSGPKCMETVFSVHEVVAHAANQTCADSAALVMAYSKRSGWRKYAPILNAKCNPATPFPLDLQDTETLYDAGWSSRVDAEQPAAFHATKDDSRVLLREITHGSTVVFPGSYTLTMNMSDYHFYAASDPHFFESFFKNISDGITDGFKHVQSAGDGSVFLLPLDFQMRMAQDSSEVVMEGSALMIALNASEASSYDGWRDHAIAVFHSKAPSAAIQSLVSPQTFQMSPLAHSAVQTIPAMSQNGAAAFEFSAAPSLLRRFPPPSHLRLLANFSASVLQGLGFSWPNVVNDIISSSSQGHGDVWKPCRIDSFGPLPSGTLYAGDGVVIQQPEDIRSDVDYGCIATLRYPRSSFSGNATFFWARVESTSARRLRRTADQSSDIFQPDAQVHSDDNLNATEYGRINIEFLSNGTAVHNIQPAQGSVTDHEVILKIRLTFVDALTLYAVRRFKIESYEIDATTRITPLQPSLQRSSPVVDGYFVGKPKPVDFACTELDLSALPIGARAVVTVVSPGGFDPASSVMVYQYADGDELHRPAPSSPSLCSVDGQSHAHCSSYYSLALYRQHTNSDAFHNFSAPLGRAFLIDNPGYYVGCVSASDKDASSVQQDGVAIVRFQKKSVKDSRQCASGSAFAQPQPPAPSTTAYAGEPEHSPTEVPDAPSTTAEEPEHSPTEVPDPPSTSPE